MSDRALSREADRIFDQALDLPPEERPHFLDQACAGNGELRQLVERLVSAAVEEETEVLPADGTSPPLWHSLARELTGETETSDGSRIGNFRILRELGRGGMAVVYLAERADGQFRQQVAVKRIQRGIASDEGIQRFERERRILALIRHPHIAQLLDGGLDSDGR
ncbi:MAG: protein kinase, partial [Acidobacteria bacterium]|nr:protein kinase [Acidobacteriota bacterium]